VTGRRRSYWQLRTTYCAVRFKYMSLDNSAGDLSFYAVCKLGATAGMNRALLRL